MLDLKAQKVCWHMHSDKPARIAQAPAQINHTLHLRIDFLTASYFVN